MEGGHRPALHALLVAVGVVAVDLGTKGLAAVVGPWGPIDPQHNDELSLGLASAPRPVMLAAMAALLVGAWFLTWPAVRAGRCTPWLTGLVCGGALANLVDRAASGAVHDFLTIGPVVANVADVAVLAGIVLFYVNLGALLPPGGTGGQLGAQAPIRPARQHEHTRRRARR